MRYESTLTTDDSVASKGAGEKLIPKVQGNLSAKPESCCVAYTHTHSFQVTCAWYGV